MNKIALVLLVGMIALALIPFAAAAPGGHGSLQVCSGNGMGIHECPLGNTSECPYGGACPQDGTGMKYGQNAGITSGKNCSGVCPRS